MYNIFKFQENKRTFLSSLLLSLFTFTTRRKEVDSVGRLKDSTCKTSHFLAGNPCKNEKYENLKFLLQTTT